jgi:hypothetical protein
MPPARKEPTLAQMIRRSPILDASARRQWLAVLPHLTPDDRDRLREILLEGAPHPPTAARRDDRLRHGEGAPWWGGPAGRRPSPVRGREGEGSG